MELNSLLGFWCIYFISLVCISKDFSVILFSKHSLIVFDKLKSNQLLGMK